MNTSKVQCDICGKLFSKCGIKQHRQWHINEEKRQKEREERRLNQEKRGPKIGILDYEYLQLRNDLFCQHCGKSCKNLNSLKQHEVRCKENPGRIVPKIVIGFNNIGHIGWSRGLTKESDERVKHISDSLKGRPSNSPGKCYDEEDEKKRREKLSAVAKSNNFGGYVPGSGKGHKGRYKGYWCDSSWELAYVIYNLDHNINFERNWNSFEYEYKGEVHKYLPDFICGGHYIEIKGRERDVDKYKYASVPNLCVLRESDMKPYLEYVIHKYGSDFIRLYENKNKEESPSLVEGICLENRRTKVP